MCRDKTPRPQQSSPSTATNWRLVNIFNYCINEKNWQEDWEGSNSTRPSLQTSVEKTPSLQGWGLLDIWGILKDLLSGELSPGRRGTVCPHLLYKDTCKRDEKALDTDTNTWETLAAEQIGTLNQHLMNGSNKSIRHLGDKRAPDQNPSKNVNYVTKKQPYWHDYEFKIQSPCKYYITILYNITAITQKIKIKVIKVELITLIKAWQYSSCLSLLTCSFLK